MAARLTPDDVLGWLLPEQPVEDEEMDGLFPWVPSEEWLRGLPDAAAMHVQDALLLAHDQLAYSEAEGEPNQPFDSIAQGLLERSEDLRAALAAQDAGRAVDAALAIAAHRIEFLLRQGVAVAATRGEHWRRQKARGERQAAIRERDEKIREEVAALVGEDLSLRQAAEVVAHRRGGHPSAERVRKIAKKRQP